MSEFDLLKTKLQEISNFSQEELNEIQAHFEIQSFKKNEFLLNSDEVCHYLYFVNKGILRTFHLNANASEFTRLIVSEGEFCTILISFQEKVASPAFIQALEHGSLLRIFNENFRKLISENSKFEKVYLQILEKFQNFQIKRIEFLTSYSPQEKVDIFLKEQTALSQRLTDKVIATYLQITPETFSRCKKKSNS
ncbi:cAMP-binding domain of CRP or a regulatory subunit of cAMP-dependent protein kinases [Soonwooa buanensis]|uniref:cAMP-binding domain of CRP or a regulatory subunit of cAMP-dependent protein kinases n=1 Tax=Soonwooa buanensis TaxID=619805 RepID=A0A1T5FVR0_9FLAO|nr:Crp/Fnr family transcriptional regulator [Soonwooa buanensis]SKC00248.1 cAMP-binding domain of CRP or a regulatory subunit of cAMP-dependent protein kinases [Soonwooa buanensis]